MSGFYACRRRSPPRAVRHTMLLEVIEEIQHESRRTCGARRVYAKLTQSRGLAVVRCAVELMMRRNGLAGLPDRPRWLKIPDQRVACDLVDRQFRRQFRRDEVNQLGITDITEHPTRQGRVYCAVVLDAFSRRVVGWAIDFRPHAALAMAIEHREPQGSIVHSDGGPGGRVWNCPTPSISTLILVP